MGSWNETCFISKLPIVYGEPIVMILLRGWKEVTHDYAPEQFDVDTIWSPLGLPIYGTYDGCGGIEDIDNEKEVAQYLSTVPFETEYNEAPTEVTTDNLIHFLNCAVVDSYTCTDTTYKGEELQYDIKSIIIKRSLYDLLLNHFGNRKIYKIDDNYHRVETDKTIHTALDERLSKAFDAIAAKLKEGADYDETITWWMAIAAHGLPYVEGSELHTKNSTIEYLAKQYYETHDATTLDHLKEIIIFRWILITLRLGYGTYSGRNNQSEERLIHRVVAQFILDEVQRYIEQCRDEDNDNCSDELLLSDIPEFL